MKWFFLRSGVVGVLALVGAGTAAGCPGGLPVTLLGARLAVERVPPGFLGRLTVFKHVSILNSSSGGVTVALSRRAEARVARTVNSLPVIAPVFCHENELLYTLAFHPSHSPKPLYQFQEGACGAEVLATLDGKALPPLEDRNCSLLEMVKSLAPASASGTRDAAAGCAAKPM
jgi:hypothetical protein